MWWNKLKVWSIQKIIFSSSLTLIGTVTKFSIRFDWSQKPWHQENLVRAEGVRQQSNVVAIINFLFIQDIWMEKIDNHLIKKKVLFLHFESFSPWQILNDWITYLQGGKKHQILYQRILHILNTKNVIYKTVLVILNTRPF